MLPRKRWFRVTPGSGLHGAWLNFACEGNAFVASYLIDNQQGCYGGSNADLISRIGNTACTGGEPEALVEAKPARGES